MTKFHKRDKENKNYLKGKTRILGLKSFSIETRSKKFLKECSICFNKIDIQGKMNSCDHPFCFKCIQKWSKVKFIIK